MFLSLLSTNIGSHCTNSIIPLSIVGATKFYSTLTNFLGIIGYWSSAFSAVVIVEHVIIRRNRFDSYKIQYWNNPGMLPTGLAALGAGVLAFGLVVPSMDQVWFVGPIAKHTGDIGFELAFAVTAVLYVPLRYFELRIRPLA
jgi:purine-cytosine permease-like protein